MKIDDLILELQDILGSAKSVPFSGGKVMVDSDEMYNIIEQIQDAMPSEISQAKNVVADRKAILQRLRKRQKTLFAMPKSAKRQFSIRTSLFVRQRLRLRKLLTMQRQNQRKSAQLQMFTLTAF